MLKFHWIKNCDQSVIEIIRFTRLVFGLTQSPFIPEGKLKGHFRYCTNEYPNRIEVSSEGMYVDDLGDTSFVANCAVVYAVVNQPSPIIQGLVASKSPISKRDLTTSRLQFLYI